MSPLIKVASAEGSSPRMRGAQRALDHVVGSVGIIPADAGSTRRCRSLLCRPGDHPRGCVEHYRPDQGPGSAAGSSPRMRGAQNPGPGLLGHPWIIPADARSTLGYFVSCFLLGDHPRGCEEHWIDHRLSSHTAGSSPRMRGALERWLYSDVQLRIIPADAGSTSAKSSDMAVSADHPRGCGEHPPGSRVT